MNATMKIRIKSTNQFPLFIHLPPAELMFKLCLSNVKSEPSGASRPNLARGGAIDQHENDPATFFQKTGFTVQIARAPFQSIGGKFNREFEIGRD